MPHSTHFSVLITDLYSTGEHLHVTIQSILRALCACMRVCACMALATDQPHSWEHVEREEITGHVLNRSLSTVLQVPASFSPLCSFSQVFSITPCLSQVYQAIQFPREDHLLQHMKKSTCFHDTPPQSLSL